MTSHGRILSSQFGPLSRLASLSHDLAGTAQDYGVGFAHSPAAQIVSRDQANGLYDRSPPGSAVAAAGHIYPATGWPGGCHCDARERCVNDRHG